LKCFNFDVKLLVLICQFSKLFIDLLISQLSCCSFKLISIALKLLIKFIKLFLSNLNLFIQLSQNLICSFRKEVLINQINLRFSIVFSYKNFRISFRKIIHDFLGNRKLYPSLKLVTHILSRIRSVLSLHELNNGSLCFIILHHDLCNFFRLLVSGPTHLEFIIILLFLWLTSSPTSLLLCYFLNT